MTQDVKFVGERQQGRPLEEKRMKNAADCHETMAIFVIGVGKKEIG